MWVAEFFLMWIARVFCNTGNTHKGRINDTNNF